MVNEERKRGIYYALAAFIMWGLAPIYFKQIEMVSAVEILAHRVVWSFLLLLLIIVLKKHWYQVQAVFKQPKLLLMLVLTAVILGINWGVFIWAVNNGYMIDASLGYFINPLFTILLSILFLNERLRLWQGIAVGLAAVGVLVQLISFGSIPVIALVLAVSFAFYGLFRKKIAVESLPGLLVESLILLPAALLFLLVFNHNNTVELSLANWQLTVLILSAGVVTTLPLLCFTAATKRLPYSSIGFFQYIGPSLMFMLAVFLYDETVGTDRLVTFGFIWAALIVYSFDAYKSAKLKR